LGQISRHFVANDMEKRRRTLTAETDERTLREIYLYPSQLILKDSDPWCFMKSGPVAFTADEQLTQIACSYNRVNGVYCTYDPRLLSDILRKEWDSKAWLCQIGYVRIQR
jgi:beta-glucosidase